MFSPKFSLDGSKMPRKGKLKLKRRSDEVEFNPGVTADRHAEENSKVEENFNRRPIMAMSVVVALVFGLLFVRLFSLQIVNGQRNLGLAEGNRIRQKINRAPRGAIYDRNGKLLVKNIAGFDVTATRSLLPESAAERQVLYARLARLLKIPVSIVKQRAENEHISPLQPQLIASNLTHRQALLVEQDLPRLPGFYLDVNPTREYLDGGLLSHFLGYIGRVSEQDLANDRTYLPTDYIGKLGIESQYESDLRGRSGSEQIEVDAVGNPIKVLASVPSQIGQDLTLTIDFALQQKLSEALIKQIRRAGSTKGAAVAVDPRNGEVLAAVSYPSYDGNLFANGIKQADYDRLLNNPAQPLFNKAIGGAYPTGSIIKPLVASTALQVGAITPETTVNDTGALVIANRYDPKIKYTFRSYDAGGLGVVNVTSAIQKSSNVFFYTVGGGYGPIQGIGVTKLAEYLFKFGLGALTGIDVPGETNGRVPTPEWKEQATGEAWYTGDTYNMAVGQGDLLASPLQMAMAESVVANGGKLFRPHLVKAVKGGAPIKPKLVRQNFIAQQNLNLVRNAMRLVVTSGTACCLIEKEVPVKVAAKTGTAETDPNGKRKPHAWFTAFAPFDNPKIEIVALVENSGEGAEYAAPVVREVLSWYFRR